MIPTFKRVVKRPHHIYKREEVEDILIYLSSPSLERRAIAEISRVTGIPNQTLHDWHRARIIDANWFPLASGHPQARALDPQCESGIADFVRVNYIRPGIGATRTELKCLCLDCYALQIDEERH
jgi:hypothetical protein